MAWFLLSIAIVAEIAGTLFLKASDGLSKLWPSIGVAVGYVIAFSLMAISLKKLEVAKSFGGECLSKEYFGRKHKYEWRCKAGHVFLGDFNNMKFRNKFCSECDKAKN
jgi:hypothetical protein